MQHSSLQDSDPSLTSGTEVVFLPEGIQRTNKTECFQKCKKSQKQTFI